MYTIHPEQRIQTITANATNIYCIFVCVVFVFNFPAEIGLNSCEFHLLSVFDVRKKTDEKRTNAIDNVNMSMRLVTSYLPVWRRQYLACQLSCLRQRVSRQCSFAQQCSLHITID